MLVYLTDVRGERVVIIQVNWISKPSSLRSSSVGGAGGARTHDRRIMSPLL
jgi:hypothetical protein